MSPEDRESRRAAVPPARWSPTVALGPAVGAAAVLLALAALLGRQDLLLLALPLAVGAVLPLADRAWRAPVVRLRTASATLFEGQSTTVSQQLHAPDAVDVIRLRTRLEGRAELAEGGQDVCATAGRDSDVILDHRLAAPRWGRSRIGPVSMDVTAAHGLLRTTVTGDEVATLATFPLRAEFSATDLLPAAPGIVGAHRSRRVGEGVDPAGVRPFVAGDRLRRINWPVSLRTGDLHVTATYSDRDTEVVLVLDTAFEVGAGAGPGTASNLDVAVRATASIAEHYLRHGDRVAVLDLGRAGRPIRPRTGQAHLFQIMDVLLDVRSAPVSELAANRAMARISGRALVIVLSPLLSAEVAIEAAGLSRAGRSVLVVDTLPADVALPERGPWLELAWRVQLAERRGLVGALADHGVPVVPWLGSGSLDQVLAGLSRTARAARVRR
ncbi:MAG TPA: DUF58 domain-containing protein [Jatrophihabitans sp.]|uniref:DUF58 domain-containing protein n=1 Tax=Jatrophihabitans sp. TaxID=1932789 RepID=UPI002EEF47C7